MADTLTTIVTSAAVAAIVSGAAVAWNGWRDRRSRIDLQRIQETHEAALRNLDRQHERRLQEFADQRGLRDLKAERLRTNLVTLIDAAMKLGDRALQLRMEPDRFVDPDPAFDQARTRLSDLRPALLLDTESERLLRAMAELTRQYDVYLIALRQWRDLTDLAKAAVEAGPGASAPPGQQILAALQQAQDQGESLANSVQELIDSARETLEGIERPIG